jgi:hypothetical protein
MSKLIRDQDSRRVKDVKPREERRLEDFYGDLELWGYGWSGETATMRLRLRRQRQLAAEGRGPLHAMREDLRAMGYRSPWRPYYPAGTAPLPPEARGGLV